MDLNGGGPGYKGLWICKILFNRMNDFGVVFWRLEICVGEKDGNKRNLRW